MIKIFPLTFVFLFISNIQIFSQACCTVGTSISNGGERSAIPVNTLSTALTLQHNVLNSAYQSSTEIEDPLNRKSTVTNYNLEIEYGLVEKVSILLILPYSNRSRETTVTNTETNSTEVINFTGSGFGDIIILGKYEVVTPSILSPFGLAFGGGAKLPTGSFEEEETARDYQSIFSLEQALPIYFCGVIQYMPFLRFPFHLMLISFIDMPV